MTIDGISTRPQMPTEPLPPIPGSQTVNPLYGGGTGGPQGVRIFDAPAGLDMVPAPMQPAPVITAQPTAQANPRGALPPTAHANQRVTVQQTPQQTAPMRRDAENRITPVLVQANDSRGGEPQEIDTSCIPKPRFSIHVTAKQRLVGAAAGAALGGITGAGTGATIAHLADTPLLVGILAGAGTGGGVAAGAGGLTGFWGAVGAGCLPLVACVAFVCAAAGGTVPSTPVGGRSNSTPRAPNTQTPSA